MWSAWTRAGQGDSRQRSEASAHLPEALELPLLDAQQLAGLPADDGGVARRVVQDGLAERRADAQRADGDGILHASTQRNQVIRFMCMKEDKCRVAGEQMMDSFIDG